MNKAKDNLLTKNQFAFLLMGFAVGPAFLRLPNALCKNAKQDAWIAALIGLIYPVYILIISNYVVNNHPKENLLILTKKYFGNILGIVFNCIFLFQFILYTCTIIIDFATVNRLYVVAFLTPLKVILITIILCAYTSSKCLKVLGKINELATYILIAMIIFSLSALNYGSILNIQPVLGTDIKNIFKATKEVPYFYSGFEFLLLYHPFVQNTNDIKKASIKAIIIAGSIWTWVVFISIYYLGIDIIPKSFYSFILVFESVHVPIVNNFRYVAMFAWTLVSFRIISNYYFTVSFVLSDITKIHIKKLNLLMCPVILFLCIKVIDTILKKDLLNLLSATFSVFNIVFLSLLAILVFIKFKSVKQNQN